jgi:hypothetical protein
VTCNTLRKRALPKPELELIARYYEPPHIGKLGRDLSWQPDEVAVSVVITNKSVGPLEKLILNVVMPPDIGVIKAWEIAGVTGTSVGLPNMPRPKIVMGNVIQDDDGDPNPPPREVKSNTIVVSCKFLENNQALWLEMATRNASADVSDKPIAGRYIRDGLWFGALQMFGQLQGFSVYNFMTGNIEPHHPQ